MITKFFKKIINFIVEEIAILIVSVIISLGIIFGIWIVTCENGMTTLEAVKVGNEICDINITCVSENNLLDGFIVDRTERVNNSFWCETYPGDYITAILSGILFLLFTVWNVLHKIINLICNLLYGNKMKNQIYDEFQTPEYDVVLRTNMLDECVSIREIQRKLIKLKEEKEKNKDDLNVVHENLIFENIDEEDELYKLVMDYKWTIDERENQTQFNEIHILINERMRKHGLLKRYTINDFFMMLSNRKKIDKNELIRLG